MTSLTFMFVDVPAPPWKTSMGNWSMQRWCMSIWSHAHTIASALSRGSACSRTFASAAAFFTMTMPRMNSGSWLRVVRETWKFSTARRVWMP